jgi:predicted NAD-dependent protein-ADP-ribosyltransferase YbiA (DUF1768 family)
MPKRCFSVCRKRSHKDCKTRFCNYIQGSKREFCRLTPRYKLNEDCIITKKYTKKNSQLIINNFINNNIKRRKTNRKIKAANTISNFIKKKLKKKNDTLKNIKVQMETPQEVKQIEMELVPFNEVSELVKREKMYDPTIQFYFYSGSKNAPPGKGAREIIPTELLKEYKDSLAEFTDFRKMLSNFGEAHFVLDGLNWNSVEHYYQASKFKKNNPDFYRSFALESGSELSKDPVMAKAYGGKSGKYKGKLVRPKNILLDDDFFLGRGDKEMFDAQLAKFTQNENMRNMLIATKDAQLMHTISRSTKSIPFDNLVYFRDLMKKGLI